MSADMPQTGKRKEREGAKEAGQPAKSRRNARSSRVATQDPKEEETREASQSPKYSHYLIDSLHSVYLKTMAKEPHWNLSSIMKSKESMKSHLKFW
jgi:hypothetical protein